MVTDQILTQFYEGNGLFARIIDIPAEETVRTGFELKDIAKADRAYCANVLDELEWEDTASTAIRWARLFGGSIAVMLINDGHGLEEPLDWKNIRSIDGIRVYDRSVIKPDYQSMFSYDPRDPFGTRGSRLGMPEFYNVYSKYGHFSVHDSRCLIFQNGKLPENTTETQYQLWGMPEYVRVHKAIRNVELAHGNVQRILGQSMQAVYKVKNLDQLLAAEQGEELLLKRLQVIDMARSMLGIIAIDGDNEEYKFSGFQLSGVSDIIASTYDLLSAVTSIPKRLLFGRQTDRQRTPLGHSADCTSLENWYNYVEHIRKEMLHSNLRYLLSIIFQAGVHSGELREVPPINIEFAPLWSLSELEAADAKLTRAGTQLSRARTARTYVDMQALYPDEVRRTLKGRRMAGE